MIDLFPLIRPFIFAKDAEKAHNLTINLLKKNLNPVFFAPQPDPILSSHVFGLDFANPVGLAAGFDKDAEVMRAMQKAGFGFVEAGTVTPLPQEGNPKPRLFRLEDDRAVINRFGFNNKGLESFAENLQQHQQRTLSGKTAPVGANVGANKDASDRTADYVTCIKRLYGLSDYFTVNISSPNTPGLRALQSKAALEDLVDQVLTARAQAMQKREDERRIPILVKIAPDLLDQDKEDIASIALDCDIDGLIVTNTTIDRPDSLRSAHKAEAGGLSGKPVFEKSTQVLSDIYKLTKGQVPLVGVGGIESGADAYQKIRAGASLVQVYSMLVYNGPAMVARINRDLAALLKADGFEDITAAVGADHGSFD